MGRGVVLLASAALALCGCQKAEDKSPAARPAPAPSAATATPPAVAKAACAPAPKLALSRDFADPHGAFGADSEPFKQLEANFAAAYKKSCDAGVLAKQPLVPPTVPHSGMLFVHNAPEANDVAIYLEPNEGDRRSDILLEYYFVTADGRTHVPSAADLQEAIYCDTVGASEQEKDESGRCLVD